MKRLVGVMLVAGRMGGVALASDMPFPGPAIQPTTVAERDGCVVLANNVLTVRFARSEHGLRLATLGSDLNGLDLAWSDTNLFTLHLADGRPLASASMRLSAMATRPTLSATFEDETTGLRVDWSAAIPAGGHYLRQVMRVIARRGPVAVDRIEMLRAQVPGVRATGAYDGLPLITDQLFLGIEHPMAQNRVRTGAAWSPVEMQARQFDLPVGRVTGTVVEVRFDYQRGNHRIDVAGVAWLDAAGRVLAEDVHDGFSGHAVSRNTYRLPVPAGATGGRLRVTLGGDPAQTDSWGAITLAGAAADASPEVNCWLPRRSELAPGSEWTISSGIGIYPPGQLRRSFLRYVERERAHPYRSYWHYNSWYDLNIGRNDDPDPLKRMTEAQCLAVIEAFGRELHAQRGVGLDGYVWDDGWDDWNSLWGFHAGFPNGFTKLKEAAARQGAGMGAWLSPWGGYGGSKAMRVTFGRAKGYETNAQGFSLGGPKYYAAYRDVCLMMIRAYNQNYFKFDGIGGGTMAGGAPASIAPDLDALVRLLRELRQANPSVYINCTVGTWPSPYWTWFADSIWRQGEDCSYAGEGNPRERWITYRDHMIHSRFVGPSPLYPLNSLMYHGLLVGDRHAPGRMPTPAADPDSCRHEILMSVGCGSGLGELYVTPALMTSNAWDLLAAGIRWNRSRGEILRDTHWVGGAPDRAVYGYAAWHPERGGTLVLRNPTARPQSFALDIGAVLELTGDAPRRWNLRAPVTGQSVSSIAAVAGQVTEVLLPPYEVLLFDVVPAAKREDEGE